MAHERRIADQVSEYNEAVSEYQRSLLERNPAIMHNPDFIALLIADAITPKDYKIIVGDWWDDVTNTVSDAAGDVWGDTYGAAYDAAVQYAKDHPDQVKALAVAAATAAGTAVAGPAGGAIAGGIAGSVATAASQGKDVTKAAEDAAKAAAMKAAGLPADTHAALHNIAQNAFVHGALATKAINLTSLASFGDENAQHELQQTAQAAIQGNSAAQVMTAVAYHAAPAVSNGYASALNTMMGWR